MSHQLESEAWVFAEVVSEASAREASMASTEEASAGAAAEAWAIDSGEPEAWAAG